MLAPIGLRLYEQNLTFNDIRSIQTLNKGGITGSENEVLALVF